MSNKEEILNRIAALIGAANIAGCNSSHVTIEMLAELDQPVDVGVVGTLEVKIEDTLLQTVRDELNSKERIFFDIVAERLCQNKQWGGPTVDDTRSGDNWLGYLQKQVGTARRECLDDFNVEIVDPEGYRSRLVKIAALAVAALESFDRKNPNGEAEPEPRDFDKAALLEFLDAALPPNVGVRQMRLEFWALLDGRPTALDGPLQQAAAAVRDFNAIAPGVQTAQVGADYCDGSITIEVGA